MDKRYDHEKWEEKIYKKWEKSEAFSPEGAAKLRQELNLENKEETFCVLMPPPNANAPLHCGHVTYAIQDVMTRWKRMQGYKTLYVPGTDHAGFETQVVYERNLKEKGQSRFDFDRETLYDAIYKFVEENSDLAINQLKLLGMSADWDRNLFMLDEYVIETVYTTFMKMHKDGLVYRDDYMVNYSPVHGTTFSNLETTHIEVKAPLYYVLYLVSGRDNQFVTVATTRPETIYADVAIAVNPDDKRYQKLVGEKVINPLNGREMPVIEDSYVDVEFGTGALKITPAHDFNDYEIGKKHGLDMPSVIDLDGRMSKDALEVEGLTVIEARKKVAKLLKKKGALEKIDAKYKHSLLVDYKDEKPIEPMLLPNWFIKMDEMADAAVDAIESGRVKFNEKTWKYQILQWLDNIYDWPVSRQTVFGIRIPVWYNVEENGDLFVTFIDDFGQSYEGRLKDILSEGEFSLGDVKSGLQKVIAPKNARYIISEEDPGENYIQETDTFDTWFSSAQWPLTTLDYPDGDDFKTFFPTSFMDSMWDILFFWIARMIMVSLYLVDEVPYEQVYIHGRINDEKGRKMSKSLGNVIDPIEYVDKYGADALRMGILVGGNTAAKNTSFSEGKIRGYRNFANKIWNMARFMLLMFKEDGYKKYDDLPSFSSEIEDMLSENDKKVVARLNGLIKGVTTNLEKMRFMDAGDAIYHFMWHELADEYIEDVKQRTGEDRKNGLIVLRHAFIMSLKLLHPFMPFVTEAIWGQIPRKFGGDLIVSGWPEVV
jgi:valyl-tRNA synthetase